MRKRYETDVALLSVTTTEFRAVMHFHDWRAKTFPDDDQIYDVATFERDCREHTLVHAKIGEMGMTAAAATAMKQPPAHSRDFSRELAGFYGQNN